MLRRVPEVDIVMGPQFANQITSLLDQADSAQVCATEHIQVSVGCVRSQEVTEEHFASS